MPYLAQLFTRTKLFSSKTNIYILLNKSTKIKEEMYEWIVPFCIFLKEKQRSTQLLLSRNEGQEEGSFGEKEVKHQSSWKTYLLHNFPFHWLWEGPGNKREERIIVARIDVNEKIHVQVSDCPVCHINFFRFLTSYVVPLPQTYMPET